MLSYGYPGACFVAVLSFVVAEDLAAGTGHYNLVFGLVSTSVQIASACSFVCGESIVDFVNNRRELNMRH